jgi:hypothetical protein
MSTVIHTKSARYTVEDIAVLPTGKVTLAVRQPSGKRRYLSRQDVGTARWYPAVSHFIASRHLAAREG